MFGEPETLIIIYKDEMLANQMKKLIETKDDTDDSINGTADKSINVVSWSEKIWLGNKKAGNITSKVLFLGNIKGVDKLIPVIDTKYDNFGIRYGWAGNQAVIYAEPNEIKSIDKYIAFFEELSKSPAPQVIKELHKPKVTKENENTITEEIIINEPVVEDILIDDSSDAKAKFFDKSKNLFKKAKTKLEESYTEISKKAQDFTEENFRNKKAIEQQMLFYGVIQLYNNDLEGFMNS
ncbi:MAG: hypothetical protein IJW86_05950 [Clostridia bacterium]|nr:hypothetical protein [Clostridia bacterium]